LRLGWRVLIEAVIVFLEALRALVKLRRLTCPRKAFRLRELKEAVRDLVEALKTPLIAVRV
jgi:hypothetical protein